MRVRGWGVERGGWGWEPAALEHFFPQTVSTGVRIRGRVFCARFNSEEMIFFNGTFMSTEQVKRVVPLWESSAVDLHR